MTRLRELWLVDVPALGYAIASAVGVLCGIIGIFSHAFSFWHALFFTLSVLCGLFFVRSRRLALLLAFAGLMVLLAFRASTALGRDDRQRIAQAASETIRVELIGEIVWKERTRDDRFGSLWLESAYMSTDSCEFECGALRVRLRVPIADWEAAELGDICGGTARFVPAQEMYARKSGVLFWSMTKQHCGDARLLEGESLAVIKGHGGFRNVIYAMRERVLDVFECYLSPDARAMCGALLLGERVAFSPEFQSELNVTGLTHLFALSGLNTGLIASLLWFALSLLRVPLVGRGVIVLAGLTVYAALGLGAPSLVRSSLMAAMIIGSRLLHRKGNAANFILAAFTFELFVWPLHALDAGFLLSYLAISGLTAGYALLAKPLAGLFGEGRTSSLRTPARLIGSAVSAQVSTAPATALMFGRIPGVAVLANVVAVPGFSLLLALSIVLLLVSSFGGGIAGWIANSIELLAHGLAQVVSWSALLPGAGFSIDGGFFVKLFWLALSIAAVVSLVRQRARTAFALLLIAGNGVIWSNVFFGDDSPQVNPLSERSCLVTSDRSAILVGCGSSQEGERIGSEVAAELSRKNLDGIDLVVLPAARATHSGGLPGVLSSASVGRVLWIPMKDETWTSATCEVVLSQYGIEASRAIAGTKMHFADLTEVSVLWPPEHSAEEFAVVRINFVEGESVLIQSTQDESSADADYDSSTTVRIFMQSDGTLCAEKWQASGGAWRSVLPSSLRFAGWMGVPHA